MLRVGLSPPRPLRWSLYGSLVPCALTPGRPSSRRLPPPQRVSASSSLPCGHPSPVLRQHRDVHRLSAVPRGLSWALVHGPRGLTQHETPGRRRLTLVLPAVRTVCGQVPGGWNRCHVWEIPVTVYAWGGRGRVAVKYATRGTGSGGYQGQETWSCRGAVYQAVRQRGQL